MYLYYEISKQYIIEMHDKSYIIMKKEKKKKAIQRTQIQNLLSSTSSQIQNLLPSWMFTLLTNYLLSLLSLRLRLATVLMLGGVQCQANQCLSVVFDSKMGLV